MAVDTTAFPVVSLTLQSGGDSDLLPEVTVREDGRLVGDVNLATVRAEMDIYFVIDANDFIFTIDEIGGQSRLATVLDSINLFAGRYMGQRDRISVLVPDGDNGRFLIRQSNDVFSIQDALAAYEPGELGTTPLNEMLASALTAASNGNGFKALLLFSDSGSLDEQLDFDALVGQAQAADVALYVAILGARADTDEVASAARLYEPTGGAHFHVPAVAASEQFYTTWAARTWQIQVQYRSRVAESGRHTITVEAGTGSSETSYEIDLTSPVVRLTNSQVPIRRVAPSTAAGPAEMTPSRQQIVAQIHWPDGYPRLLADATLLSDGIEQAAGRAPVLNGNLLTLAWDIGELDEGSYLLRLEVTDELGLEGADEAFFTVEVERPAATAAATAVAAPITTVAPTATAVPAVIWTDERLEAGLAALLAFLFTSVFLMLLHRRRQRRELGLSSTEAEEVADEDRAGSRPPPVPAYLEILSNAPEHPGPILLLEENIAIGRDAGQAQVVFHNETVSPLHARIMRGGETFRIYDEGSTDGTFLNFERMGLSSQPLRDGDEIYFGRVHLRFRVGELEVDSE